MNAPDRLCAYAPQDERNARRSLLPAVITIYINEAVKRARRTPAVNEVFQFPLRNAKIEGINFCPAVTSTFAIFTKAAHVLGDGWQMSEILTDDQRNILDGAIEFGADVPDNHFKNNFLTSYPLFALGLLHELIYAGEIEKPETVRQVLELLKDTDLHGLMREGMHTASRVWSQEAKTSPWEIFRNFRHLYNYGKESPFIINNDGSRSFKSEITTHLHAKMRAVNQKGERAAVSCPIAVRTIYDISNDPSSCAYISEDQRRSLITPDPKSGLPLATQNEKGAIHIEFDALNALSDFFLEFAENVITQRGVPVLIDCRGWPHKDGIIYIDQNESVPSALKHEPRPDCPLNSDENIIFGNKPCSCAA